MDLFRMMLGILFFVSGVMSIASGILIAEYDVYKCPQHQRIWAFNIGCMVAWEVLAVVCFLGCLRILYGDPIMSRLDPRVRCRSGHKMHIIDRNPYFFTQPGCQTCSRQDIHRDGTFLHCPLCQEDKCKACGDVDKGLMKATVDDANWQFQQHFAPLMHACRQVLSSSRSLVEDDDGFDTHIKCHNFHDMRILSRSPYFFASPNCISCGRENLCRDVSFLHCQTCQSDECHACGENRQTGAQQEHVDPIMHRIDPILPQIGTLIMVTTMLFLAAWCIVGIVWYPGSQNSGPICAKDPIKALTIANIVLGFGIVFSFISLVVLVLVCFLIAKFILTLLMEALCSAVFDDCAGDRHKQRTC